MPRSTQLLHPQREPAPALAAATVLLLRDGPHGLEVLMTRRSLSASFAPGAYVFPGGGIEAGDGAAHDQATRRPAQSAAHLTQAIAAIRESFEELGVLLARQVDGAPVPPATLAQFDRHAPLLPQCVAHGLRLAAADVYVLARWITDRDLPRRFDVPFLVARMPDGQIPVADGKEQFEPVWVRPQDALARHAAGDFFIIFPTIRTLERLQDYPDVKAVLAACASEQPLWTSCPRAGLLAGKEARYMEHEPPYGELALVCPDGQILHALDWQSQQPVPLLKNVQRLTAPNPGFMTGPGTNSYLVGDPRSGYVVIDPGPADTAHVERLWRAAGGNIRAIVCTHSHPDHFPGARPLQALCSRPPPILGLPSQPTARANSQFTPDRALADGEELVLEGGGSDGTQTHTLRVIHTPGHAANHLCLLLQEDGLLFSGDHILNGSTTVIDPPDGDMTAYLESLDKLDAACAGASVGFILPAHGHVLAPARAVIAHLKQHRLAREAKVLAVMKADPDGTLDDWVARAYDDVPERVWPVAKRSLLAHVGRIRAMAPGND
ncbi:MAG TPA: MBL fold metallo-hydrolase [Ottowia sp.]|uniref:MBL fold metallo-hydrolase n=1 Tax=Ottowia sp. TaxID=1898956 RepID=UPI002CD6006E|nr:MBL fold metallo-hydrolase [Ottowia sp.]HMN19921.1 MBL fold metallo-hydrolase [Ottowia sp.]